MTTSTEPILSVENLHTSFFTQEGTVKAVQGTSFAVQRGEILGIVGESGCGKTTAGLSVMGLITHPGRVVDGRIRFRGRDLDEMDEDERRILRGEAMAMIFQDPQASLNPLMTVGDQIAEIFQAHGRIGADEVRQQTEDALASLGLAEATDIEDTPRGAAPAAPAEGSNGQTSGLPGVLVAKYSPPGFTTAILQGSHLRLFRTVGVDASEEGLLSPADVLEVLHPSVVYFQDNFAGPLQRACLCGLGEYSAAIAEALEGEMHLKTAPLVPEQHGSADTDRNRWERHFAALLGVAREQAGL